MYTSYTGPGLNIISMHRMRVNDRMNSGRLKWPEVTQWPKGGFAFSPSFCRSHLQLIQSCLAQFSEFGFSHVTVTKAGSEVG